MITLFQFRSVWGVPSPSPYCLKLETCLRIYEIPYRNVTIRDLSKAPKGKAPYISYQDELIGDSGLIISRLQADGLIPANPTPGDVAFQRLVEEHLAPALVYFRWIDDTNFAILKKELFGSLPFPLRQVVPAIMRKKARTNLKGHGLALHQPQEIAAMVADDAAALAWRLGDQPFFGGEQPGILDATVYGTLANLLIPHMTSPASQAIARYPELVRFCERITARLYPELKEAAA